MERIVNCLDFTWLDAAPGPAILLLLGIPLAIFTAVILIAFVTIMLIRRARKKARAKMMTGNPGDNTANDVENQVQQK